MVGGSLRCTPVTAQLLIIAGMPVCAMVTGVILWLVHRDEPLEDTDLQRRFLFIFAICFGLGWALLRTDSVRVRWDTVFRIKTEIEANELWKTIDGIDESGTGRALRQSLEQQMIAGASLKEALAGSRPILDDAARYRLAFADQQSRIAWGRYVTDTLEELQQQDPEDCYLMVTGESVNALDSALSEENTEAFHDALIGLYESSDRSMRRERSPSDEPTDLDEGRREFAAIEEELTGRYGPEVTTAITRRKFEDSPASSATMCRARIFQLEAILERPQGVAAMLVGDALR